MTSSVSSSIVARWPSTLLLPLAILLSFSLPDVLLGQLYPPPSPCITRLGQFNVTGYSSQTLTDTGSYFYTTTFSASSSGFVDTLFVIQANENFDPVSRPVSIRLQGATEGFSVNATAISVPNSTFSGPLPATLSAPVSIISGNSYYLSIALVVSGHHRSSIARRSIHRS